MKLFQAQARAKVKQANDSVIASDVEAIETWKHLLKEAKTYARKAGKAFQRTRHL